MLNLTLSHMQPHFDTFIAQTTFENIEAKEEIAHND